MHTWERTDVRLAIVVLCLFYCLPVVGQRTPQYRFDPTWPKKLPNNWVIGEVEGISVDKDGHIWLIQERAKLPPRSLSNESSGNGAEIIGAPSVLEFDADGNLLKFWGADGYIADWPIKEHDIYVDRKGNVWIAGIFSPRYKLPAWRQPDKLPWDRSVLKFSPDGRLLLEIGHSTKAPINNQDTSILGGPASIQVDVAASEVYIADGHLNKRIVVYDSETGAFKRGWGAYGIPLNEIDNSPIDVDPPSEHFDPAAPAAKQFRGRLTDLRLSNDGLLYVGDSFNHRVQVFNKQGKFIKEFMVCGDPSGHGTLAGIALSPDPAQKYIFTCDGDDGSIQMLDRSTGAVMATISHQGPSAMGPGKLNSIELDAHGNIYLGDGSISGWLQRFLKVN